jgi:hypothetical protein
VVGGPAFDWAQAPVGIDKQATASPMTVGRRKSRDFRCAISSQLDTDTQFIASTPMVDRFILLVLFGLIILYTAAMAWVNRRNPPE